MAISEQTKVMAILTGQAPLPGISDNTAVHKDQNEQKRLIPINKDRRPTRFKVYKFNQREITPGDAVAIKRAAEALMATHDDETKPGIPFEDMANGLRDSSHNYGFDIVSGEAPVEEQEGLLHEAVDDPQGNLLAAYRRQSELSRPAVPSTMGFLPSPAPTDLGENALDKWGNSPDLTRPLGEKADFVEALVFFAPKEEKIAAGEPALLEHPQSYKPDNDSVITAGADAVAPSEKEASVGFLPTEDLGHKIVEFPWWASRAPDNFKPAQTESNPPPSLDPVPAAPDLAPAPAQVATAEVNQISELVVPEINLGGKLVIIGSGFLGDKAA